MQHKLSLCINNPNRITTKRNLSSFPHLEIIKNITLRKPGKGKS